MAPKAVVFRIILLMHVTTFRILGYADIIFLMRLTMGIILYFVNRASCYKFLLITNLTHFFMYLIISFLYMF